MEEETDFLKLSIEERCQHKLWKARVSGYEDAAKVFRQQDDEKSPEFNKYLGLLKKFLTDSNAVAQEKGLVAVLAFVENAACTPRAVSEILNGLVSKCFSSPRTKTKELALEITLMLIEIEKQEAVMEELTKGLENKSPKVVSSCIVALREALHLFGSKVISLKPLVKALPKLLEDRDKSVRDESKLLCVEIYRWVGDALKTQLQSLKPVTLSELEKEFQKTVGEKVVPTRYLKSQQETVAKTKENDAVEAEATEEFVPPTVVDPFDLMTAVDILSKLPSNFYEQCEAKKWQERKEVVETLLQLTTNVKLEPGDYGDLVRMIKKLITKDSNVVVVGLAVKCLNNLITGLRKKFHPYASAMLPAVFEKFKEKKQNVVVPLRESIDSLYGICGFEAMLEDIQAALDNKNPQIKAETCAFLSRAFATCTAAQLNKKLLKAFTASLLKTLNDTDGTVRENAAEALGTALKVVGERVMSNFLQEVDAIKMAKIKDFCEKAEVKPSVPVESKPASAPAAVKRAPVKQEDPMPEPAKPEPVKQPAPVNKKIGSGLPTKSKGSAPAARSVRSGGAKRGQPDAGEPEFKENELSEEDVMTQASEIFADDVLNGLGSSNWKDRLAACEKFFEIVRAMEKTSLPGQCLVKILAKKPGFKENNFQILKLRFEILVYIAENAQISHITVECCLSDVVDKIGDAKSGVHAGSALIALAGATSLDYISLEVLNLAFNQKNPKNQSEALIWVSNAIKQFGFKVQVKEMIDNLKKGFSSTNPGVRNAALALVGTMYMYVGKSLRSFFENEKAALLQQIDAEFEKVKDSKPPAPVKGKAAKADGSGDATEGCGQVNLADLMPTVDISSQITSQLLSDLSDKDWHLRSDALQKISAIISEAKYLAPNLGELPLALKARLADTNKKIALQSLGICQILGTSLGSNCSKQIRNFAPGILTCLGDNKANVRAAAVHCLNSWMDNCPLVSLFEGEVVFEALQTDNPLLRIELFSWLIEKLPTAASLPTAELTLCVPILLNCIEDRNPDVRKKAVDCLLPFMLHVGFEPMARAASKMKPASKATVVAQLEKVRPNLPAKPTTAKSKPSKTLADRSSPPQVASNDEGIKGKLNRSTSKSKLALKTPTVSSSKAKKEEEIDTSPSLVANNMKDQRMADEKSLKVLKWNFTNPREEFYVQLRDQMTTANWSKTLISHCFHNDFKFHIKAIDLLIESLSNSIDASAANLDLILKWLALRFFDTNPSVLIKGLEYLQVLFQALVGVNYHMLDLEAASFVPYLILKIGDPKDAVRKGVREIIKSITRTYPYTKMFSYIMQGLSSKNARQRAECLEELGYMIESFGLNACQPSPAVALKEIAKQISDRDNSVRNAALNCVVQAYFIEGEKVYKFVGQLSDKDLSLLEERIKRSSKPKISKPVESSIPSAKVSPPAAHFNTSYSNQPEEPKKATPTSRSAHLRLDTDDIEQMFQHKEPQAQFPGLIKVNADDILNLPDIQLPRTRMRPPATSLKILNNADDVDTAVNLVMAQLAAQEIPVVMQAFVQIEEVLKSDQAVRVLQSRVDQLLVFGALQYRYAHNKHMADENICKAEVVSLYRCVTMALASLFDNPALAKKASRDVIRDLIPHLITVMLDNRLDDLQDGALVVKVINVLIMRILQKANPTHVLSALIKLLHDCIGNLNVSERFTDLIMKCLWKMIRMIRFIINDLNIDRILLDIHVFLKTFPSSTWKERPSDTPIRTIKTTLYKLVEIKGEDIMKHLSLISDRQESDLVNYLHKLLARVKEDNRKSSNKNSAPDDNSSGNNRQKRCRSSPLKLSKSTHEALTEIFRKIGCKEQTKEGLSELYEFTQNHPEADIEPYLKTSSDFFQNYIRQGIQQLEKEKGCIKSGSLRREESGGWNSNLPRKDISFSKDKKTSQLWEDKFPPVPPCTVDTTPMDLVEWLKNVVARLGMDTSKYDDPSFLEKINGNGNDGPLSDEEISQMFSDIERYRKMIEDLKNAV